MSRIRFKGYSSFIKKTESKKDNPSGMYQWDEKDLRSVEVRSLSKVYTSILFPDIDLIDAFIWKTTPQGDVYWSKKYVREERLTKEDKQFLKALLDYHEYKPRLEANSSEQSTPF